MLKVVAASGGYTSRTPQKLPSENAPRIKDPSGRLTLHVATERSADINVLRLLVHGHAHDCFRRSREGDQPLHLLVRSGKATKEMVEMLLKSITRKESVSCARRPRLVSAAARGGALPMLLRLLQSLLRTYGRAATGRRRPETAATEKRPHQPRRPLRVFRPVRHGRLHQQVSPRQGARATERVQRVQRPALRVQPKIHSTWSTPLSWQ